MGCYFLLQGIFPTQGSNPGLLHCSRFFTNWPTRKPSIALGPYTIPHPLIIPSLTPYSGTDSVLAKLASLLFPKHTRAFWTTLPWKCSWASFPHLLWQSLKVPLLIKAVTGHIFAFPCLPFLFHSIQPHPAHGPWSPLAGFGEHPLVVHLSQAGKLHETCIFFIHHCVPNTLSRVWPRVWALYIFVKWYTTRLLYIHILETLWGLHLALTLAQEIRNFIFIKKKKKIGKWSVFSLSFSGCPEDRGFPTPSPRIGLLRPQPSCHLFPDYPSLCPTFSRVSLQRTGAWSIHAC